MLPRLGLFEVVKVERSHAATESDVIAQTLPLTDAWEIAARNLGLVALISPWEIVGLEFGSECSVPYSEDVCSIVRCSTGLCYGTVSHVDFNKTLKVYV